MHCARRAFIVLAFALFVAAVHVPRAAVAAPTIWSGLELTFSRPADGEPALPESQDRITQNVWLTRDLEAGIFNIAPGQEVEYDKTGHLSPAGTLWATPINNPLVEPEAVVATNWANLEFTPWREAYNGGQGRLPTNLMDNAAVVWIVGDEMTTDDDIYFDLQFLSWGQGGGPTFSYARGLVPRTGDYNGDLTVNAADYTVWRNSLGEYVNMRGSGADGDASGKIDMGDYFFWRDHYGETVPENGAALGSGAVPEPATIVLLLTALGGAAFARRRVTVRR